MRKFFAFLLMFGGVFVSSQNLFASTTLFGICQVSVDGTTKNYFNGGKFTAPCDKVYPVKLLVASEYGKTCEFQCSYLGSLEGDVYLSKIIECVEGYKPDSKGLECVSAMNPCGASKHGEEKDIKCSESVYKTKYKKPNIDYATKCKVVCKDGVWIHSVLECKSGWKPNKTSGATDCVKSTTSAKNKKNTSNNTSNNSSNSTAEVDDPCASKLSGMNATEAEQKNNKCIATTCKNGYYKYKVKGTYQGYCVAKSVCNNSSNTKAGTTEVKIDDDYISCAKPEKPEEPEEPENPEEPTTNTPGTDEETPQSNPGTVAVTPETDGETGQIKDCEADALKGVNATSGVVGGDFGDGCVPTVCIDGYNLVGADNAVVTQSEDCQTDKSKCLKNVKCIKADTEEKKQEDVLNIDDACTAEKKTELNISSGVSVDGTCVPTKCLEGFVLQDENNKDFNQPTECESGSNLDKCNKDVKCVKTQASDGSVEQPQVAPQKTLEQLEEERRLEEERKKEELQQKRVAELEENAQKMRDKEQSMENKLLGAAGMGMTGMGLMQSMSASAEQKADEAAELDMAAYLATMHCNYAPGKNVQGGEKEVELPGANSLLPLYTEYVALANDLKIRKEALGMQPGIESEAILDGATSGLYDDVALGKTGGAYTSLARALSDPNGEDAKKWAAQKEETAKDKKTGTTLAAVGAIGSAVGNVAINKNAPKEGSDEINAKYDKKRVSADTSEKGDKDGVDGDNGNSGGVAPVPKNDKIADKKCDPACDANTHDCVDGVCVEKIKNLNQEQVFVDICDNDSLNGKPGYYCIDGDFEFESKNIDVLTTFAKEYAKQRHGRSINCDKELIDSGYDEYFYLRCADGNSAFYNFDFRISDFADEEDMSDNICYIYFGDDCLFNLYYSIGMFDVMRPFVESVGYNFVLGFNSDEYELKKCSGGCSGKTLIPNENQSVTFDKAGAVAVCSVYGELTQDSDNCINADEVFEFDYNDINLFTKYAKEYAKQKYGRIIDCDDVLVKDAEYVSKFYNKHDLICADEKGLFYDFEFYISDSVTDENKIDNICRVYSSTAEESEKQPDRYFCDYVKSKDLCNVILPFAESVGYSVSFEDEECIIYKK